MVKNIPDPYDIIPLVKPPHCTIEVPGSKSITNRAMILAALAQPVKGVSYSLLKNALQSEDTEVMIDSLQRLGIAVETDWAHNSIMVPCLPISAWNKDASFFCGNSGTTIRFLTSMLSIGAGVYRLDGIERMRERPIGDLLSALQSLGVDIKSDAGNGCPPVSIYAHGLAGGKAPIRGDVSSQYLSALLMVAPYAREPLTLQVVGELVSIPYIAITLQMMSDWGVAVTQVDSAGTNSPSYEVQQASYLPRTYAIEPDASSASYFWASAAITGGRVSVPGLARSIQGDAAFRDALVQMGCRLVDADTIEGAPLQGIAIDMNAISDTVMTLAVVALFAEGPTTITHVAHIRHKETDRLAALATELRKVGAQIDELADGLIIHPRPLHGALLDTYNDHRMAMSLALIGLRIPGIRINNPGCVAKTFPSYWQRLENLRQCMV